MREHFSISFRSLFNMSIVKVLRSQKQLLLLFSIITSQRILNGSLAHRVLIKYFPLYYWRHYRYILLVKLRSNDYF
jgi:hypothetical protein